MLIPGFDLATAVIQLGAEHAVRNEINH
jgi:hypothetical protein